VEAIDALFQASHEREAYAKGTATRILNFLRDLEVDTAAKLAARIERLSERDKANFVRNRTRGQYSTERLERLLDSIRETSIEWRRLTEENIGLSAKEVAASELALQTKALEIAGVIGEGISIQAAVSAAYAQPLLARPLREYFKDQQASVRRAITDSLRRSFVAGETVDQAVKSLIGTKALNYTDGDLRKNRNGVRMLVRTGLNHISNVTTRETYKALGVTHVIFIGVMDSRQSTICAGLSGRRLDLNNPNEPFPLRHPNCRSTIVPDIEGLSDTTRPAVGANGVTQIPADLTYKEFFDRQPVSWQRDQLTALQYRLYREGNLEFSQFSDVKFTRELTDGELEIRYSEILGRLNGADRQAA